jgi:hypothetical protein
LSPNDAVNLTSWTEVYAESGQEAGEQGIARGNKYKQILGLKTVHTLAFFILIYVGTEVSKQTVHFPVIEAGSIGFARSLLEVRELPNLTS